MNRANLIFAVCGISVAASLYAQTKEAAFGLIGRRESEIKRQAGNYAAIRRISGHTVVDYVLTFKPITTPSGQIEQFEIYLDHDGVVVAVKMELPRKWDNGGLNPKTGKAWSADPRLIRAFMDFVVPGKWTLTESNNSRYSYRSSANGAIARIDNESVLIVANKEWLETVGDVRRK